MGVGPSFPLRVHAVRSRLTTPTGTRHVDRLQLDRRDTLSPTKRATVRPARSGTVNGGGGLPGRLRGPWSTWREGVWLFDQPSVHLAGGCRGGLTGVVNRIGPIAEANASVGACRRRDSAAHRGYAGAGRPRSQSPDESGGHSSRHDASASGTSCWMGTWQAHYEARQWLSAGAADASRVAGAT
jgi:hypothetical protein